jgi:hypothetical protein
VVVARALAISTTEPHVALSALGLDGALDVADALEVAGALVVVDALDAAGALVEPDAAGLVPGVVEDAVLDVVPEAASEVDVDAVDDEEGAASAVADVVPLAGLGLEAVVLEVAAPGPAQIKVTRSPAFTKPRRAIALPSTGSVAAAAAFPSDSEALASVSRTVTELSALSTPRISAWTCSPVATACSVVVVVLVVVVVVLAGFVVA